MKIIIIEDEAPALSRIKKMVYELEPDIEIIATADSIEQAVSVIKQNSQVDLILMDIELADGQSFEIFNLVTVQSPVIFTTAYDEFALKAFKVNSIDYLLKPIDKDELQKAFSKYKTLQKNNSIMDVNQQMQELLFNLKQPSGAYKNRFLVKQGQKLISIATDNIAYFFTQDKLCYVQTNGSSKYVIDYTLDELMGMVDPTLFFQLNRQTIASIACIQSVHTYFNGKLKVELKSSLSNEVVVSRERAAEFKDWLGK
ncbi:MAG: LytTR family DNA-binding domain-containing protein [Bacteroidota bacterium]